MKQLTRETTRYDAPVCIQKTRELIRDQLQEFMFQMKQAQEHLQGLKEEAIEGDQALNEARAFYHYLTVPEQEKHEAQRKHFNTGQERRQPKMEAVSLEIDKYYRGMAKYTAIPSRYYRKA